MDFYLSPHVAVFLRTITAINMLSFSFPWPKHFKVLFAMMMSFAISNIVPVQVDTFFYLREIFMGAVIGILGRIIISLLTNLAELISHSTGLQNQIFIGNSHENTHIHALIFWSLINVLFSCGLHHSAIIGIAKSYNMSISKDLLEIAFDFFKYSISFALMLALPLMIVGFVFHIVCALINRLIPQIPIFLITQPIVILGAGWVIGPNITAIINKIPEYFNI